MQPIWRNFTIVCSMLIAISETAKAEENYYTNDNITEILVQNTHNVSFDRLRELTILKAAEIARSRGYTHFEFMYSIDRPVSGSVERRGDILKDAYGNASQSSFPDYLFPTPIHDNQKLLIKFCNESKDSCRGLSVKDVFRNLHP